MNNWQFVKCLCQRREQVSFLTWEFRATWRGTADRASSFTRRFIICTYFERLKKLLWRCGNTQKRNLKINSFNDSVERWRKILQEKLIENFSTFESSNLHKINLLKRWAISSGAAPSKPSWTSVCLKSAISWSPTMIDCFVTWAANLAARGWVVLRARIFDLRDFLLHQVLEKRDFISPDIQVFRERWWMSSAELLVAHLSSSLT